VKEVFLFKDTRHEVPFYQIFYEKERQSLLPLLIGVEGKLRTGALFWVWLNENMVFMNGFIRNLPKLLFLELVRQIIRVDISFRDLTSQQKEFLNSFLLLRFLEFWSSLNYDLEVLAEDYFNIYDFYVGREDMLRVRIKEEHPLEAICGLEKWKGEKVLSYELMLNFFSNFEEDVLLILKDALLIKEKGKCTLSFMELEKILGSTIRRLFAIIYHSFIKKESKKAYLPLWFLFFEVFYLNIWYFLLRIPLLLKKGSDKSFYHREELNFAFIQVKQLAQLEDLNKYVRRIEEILDHQLRVKPKEILDLLESLLESIGRISGKGEIAMIISELGDMIKNFDGRKLIANQSDEENVKAVEDGLIELYNLLKYVGNVGTSSEFRIPYLRLPDKVKGEIREVRDSFFSNKEVCSLYRKAFESPLIRLILADAFEGRELDEMLEVLFPDEKDRERILKGIEKDREFFKERCEAEGNGN
jgi:hypothetical protein